MKIIPIALLLSLTICSLTARSTWFRGNTHVHTELCGHADSSPEFVAKWYHDHGYHFLVLSEHNKFIDPKDVKLPENKRDDFILIPGEEITGKKVIHTTAMNINRLVPWDYDHEEKSAIIQNHVHESRNAGGHAILNHPNFKYAISVKDMHDVKHLRMFELFNGHPGVHNDGDHKHPSTELMWDQLLTKGMLIYGVSSDDAHHFQEISAKKSNPGRGWVMVYASKLSADEITNAMFRGDFYASNGVFLKKCKRTLNTYSIKIDAEKTKQLLLSSPNLRGKTVTGGREGFKIEFIGVNGNVLKEIEGLKGTYRIKEAESYVRVKVTFTQKHNKQGLEEYYAWGQPAFNDERAEQ